MTGKIQHEPISFSACSRWLYNRCCSKHVAVFSCPHFSFSRALIRYYQVYTLKKKKSVFCYTEKRLSQSLSKVDDLLESWCVNWCVCRHKLWICRYFGPYEYQGVIWMDVSQEVFQPNYCDSLRYHTYSRSCRWGLFLKKEKCWQSFPASKPLSYAAKTNNCLQAQQWSIKSEKPFSCLEGLKVFPFTSSLWLALYGKSRAPINVLMRGKCDVFDERQCPSSYIYVCGFSLRLIFDSVQHPARHQQPSCLTFVGMANKRLLLTKTFVTAQDTSVTMMMLFLCHL